MSFLSKYTSVVHKLGRDHAQTMSAYDSTSN